MRNCLLLDLYEFSLFEYIIISFYLILGGILIIKLFTSLRHKNKTKMRLSINKADLITKYYRILVDEPDLRRLRFRFVFIKIMGIGLLILSLFFITNEYGTLRFFCFIAGFISTFFKFDKEYVQVYKHRVIGAALKEYDESLHYSPNEGIGKDFYLTGYSELFDRYSSEDRIFGYINGLELRIADVKTEDRHKSRYGDYYVTDYHGTVAILSLKKSIGFNFQITRNDKTDLFVIKDENGFVVDNPEFDACYKVGTDNPLKAAMILTPSLTNRLLDLHRIYGVGFDLKIVGKDIFVKLQTPELFEPHILNRSAEAFGIALYFEILDGLKEILKEIVTALDKIEIEGDEE